MNLFSRKNVVSFTVAVSALFLALATLVISAKILICLVPFLFGVVFWFMRKNWTYNEDTENTGLPLWSKGYLYALDFSTVFYIFQTFPFLYPNFAEAGKLPVPFHYISLTVAVLALPFIHYAWRWFLRLLTPHLQAFFRRFTRMEIIISVGLFLILVGILITCSSQSSIWLAPKNTDFFISSDAMNPENICCDVIFGSDCRVYTTLREEFKLNTFRHPFFSVVFFPFFPIFVVITVLFWGVGFGAWYYSAAAALAVIQIAWWVLTGVMLRRLLLGIVKESCSYAIMLFYLTSFPMIFTFVPERLTLTTFMLLAFLYFRRFSGNEEMWRLTRLDYLTSFAAGGTTLTSALLPVFSLWQNRKSVKNCVWECVKYGTAWLVVAGIWSTILLPLPENVHYNKYYECFRWMPLTQSWWEPLVEHSNKQAESETSSEILRNTKILDSAENCESAEIPEIQNFSDSTDSSEIAEISHKSESASALSIKTNIKEVEEFHQYRQFFHFMETCFWTPNYSVSPYGVGSVPAAEIGKGYITIGFLVSILAFIGFFLYRKAPFVQEMGVWFLVAVFLVGILGFGSISNEMTLYGMYFSWAIFPLAVLPIYRLIGDRFHQMTVILTLLSVISFIAQLYLIWSVTTQTDFMVL